VIVADEIVVRAKGVSHLVSERCHERIMVVEAVTGDSEFADTVLDASEPCLRPDVDTHTSRRLVVFAEELDVRSELGEARIHEEAADEDADAGARRARRAERGRSAPNRRSRRDQPGARAGRRALRAEEEAPSRDRARVYPSPDS
jgi:hypothetical protein